MDEIGEVDKTRKIEGYDLDNQADFLIEELQDTLLEIPEFQRAAAEVALGLKPVGKIAFDRGDRSWEYRGPEDSDYNPSHSLSSAPKGGDISPGQNVPETDLLSVKTAGSRFRLGPSIRPGSTTRIMARDIGGRLSVGDKPAVDGVHKIIARLKAPPVNS